VGVVERRVHLTDWEKPDRSLALPVDLFQRPGLHGEDKLKLAATGERGSRLLSGEVRKPAVSGHRLGPEAKEQI
jgi:hypothetical protein